MKFNYSLQTLYESYCNYPSDINEHLPTLKKYADECDHITEMGVREGVSFVALLNGKPKKMIGIDINLKEGVKLIQELAESEGLNVEYIYGDTRNINIDPTDFLFIDTWHCYEQLKEELALHHSKVNKYIGFHDTTTYEYKNEKDFPHWDPPLVKKIDNPKGLWPAIEEFLKANKNWKIKERFTNNNGLTILEKIL